VATINVNNDSIHGAEVHSNEGYGVHGGRASYSAVCAGIGDGGSGLSTPNITSIIDKTIKSNNRKKLNVVVSGLAETGAERYDKALFHNVCVDFLKYDSEIVHCVRLAQPNRSTDRPRLLLVTLSTESQVANIIKSAKLLRDATDVTVQTSVFINRDMTKEESNAAFEKSKARREKSNLSAAAPSFFLRSHLLDATPLSSFIQRSAQLIPSDFASSDAYTIN